MTTTTLTPADVDKVHASYSRGLITLGEYAETLAEIDRAYGAQPVTREELERARARCSCARHTDGSVTTFLCPVHAEQDPCYTMSSITGRRRTGTIRRGVCTSCGHGSYAKTPAGTR